MITKLYIKNFKIFRECTLLCSNLNILTGLNGMGKSTIIQTLLLLRQSFKDKNIAFLKLQLEEGELCKIGTQKQAITQKIEDNTISLGFTINKDKDYKFNFITSNESSTSSEIPNKKPNQYSDLDTLNIFNKHFQYIGAERISPSNEHSYNKDIVEKRNQISKIHGKCEYAVHYLGYKQQKNTKLSIKELQHPKETDDSLYSQVEAWLGEISPSIKVKVTVDDKTQKTTLTYTYDIGDEVMEDVMPENTGFGISYALPIVVALLSAQAGDLIIIENPESHLHPKGQSKLAELMCLAAQNGVQIFCETHSDHIVNGVYLAIANKTLSIENTKIYFFDREVNNSSSKVTEVCIDKDGFIENEIENYFDQYHHDLKTLFNLRKNANLSR